MKFALILFFTLCVNGVFSQNTYIDNRRSVTFNNSSPSDDTYTLSRKEVHINFGYAKYFEYGFGLLIQNIGYSNSYNFDINQKVHILPIFIDAKKFRFDVYVPFDFVFSYNSSFFGYKGFVIYPNSFGLGTAGFLTKHIGFTLELNYMAIYKFNVRYGLIFKWYKQ